MRTRRSKTLLLILLTLALAACDTDDGAQSGQTCATTATFTIDLNSPAGDQVMSGESFSIPLASTQRVITSSTCPGLPVGQVTDRVTVTRTGNTLMLSLGFEEISLSVTGDTIAEQPFKDENEFCINDMVWSGAIDADANLLALQQTNTITQKMDCAAFVPASGSTTGGTMTNITGGATSSGGSISGGTTTGGVATGGAPPASSMCSNEGAACTSETTCCDGTGFCVNGACAARCDANEDCSSGCCTTLPLVGIGVCAPANTCN